MLDPKIQKDIKDRLQEALRGRLQGILLYGSEARNESRADSDLDLLVLLEGPIRLGRDLEAIVDAIYPVQLELDRPIHVTPVAAESFKAGQYGIYREAQREGILL
ncbi:MAG TPA: nucleotidyltransferase domain-containing protein [Thermoanaerobaculia bacterium]